jgi:hypothetical protein
MGELILQGVFGSLLLEGEDGGWMQLLVFVVVGVLYALGGIIKAKKRKGAVEEEEDQSAGEQAPPEPQREPLRAIGRPQQPQASTLRRKSVLQTFVEEITRAAQLDAQPPQPQKLAPPLRPSRIETKIAEFPKKPTGDAIAASQPKPLALELEAKQQAQADDLPLIAPELGGPDDLARAILHYEILGKPVSLRDPAEHPR